MLRSDDLVHLPRDRPERKLLMRNLVLLFPSRSSRRSPRRRSCGRAFGRLRPMPHRALRSTGGREAVRTVDDRGLRARFPFAPGTAAGRDVRGRSAAPWRSLVRWAAVWRGRLQAPALRGLYPIELRTARAAALIDPHLFLRVFEPGTRARPAFDDPADAVRWWVRTVPRATLVALKAWPLPAFDRRDIRLHRLFVVAYSPPGYPDVERSAGHVRHGGPGRVPRKLAAPRGDRRAAMRLLTPTVG